MATTPMKRLYLDFNSDYRDRNLWPNPGEFGVLLSQSGTSSWGLEAKDPVSLATTSLAWTSQRFQADMNFTPIITGTVLGAPGIGSVTSPQVIVFESSSGDLHVMENYYRHCVVQNTLVPNESARILAYTYMGNNTGLIKVDSNMDLVAGDSIEINDPSDFLDPLNGKLFVPGGSNAPNDYFGQFIFNESIGQFRNIAGYDSDTGLLNIGPPAIPTWLPSHNYSIRKEIPLLSSTAGPASSPNTVVISGGSIQSGAYNGMFIRVVPNSYSNTTTSPQGEIRQIISYNSQTANVFPAFTSNPANTNIEILQFSYDNAHPFTYKGTLEGEPSVYAIRLLSLNLPNQILAVGNGGQIAFYPYVYVELTASDLPSNNLMMSNNPNAIKMMFKASVDNIQNLTIATFIRLNGDCMTQVFRFKTETNFKVRVILPNGETFKTKDAENMPPSESNAAIQISMLFELYRG